MSGNDASHKYYFDWYDYTSFSIMLLLSTAIGFYFGFYRKKNLTTFEYLMGNKNIKAIPVAISVTACHISGINLLGLPADTYRFGGSFLFSITALGFFTAIANFVYLPVFYNLQIISIYEYLEKRFDKKTRSMASLLYSIYVLFYLPVVVYITSLALSSATGLSTTVYNIILCVVCMLYTSIGGLKAVIWTDVFQFIIFFDIFLVVFALGLKSEGFSTVWNNALTSGRLDILNFNIDLTERNNFWTTTIGLLFQWSGTTSVSQSAMSKFLAVPSLTQAKISMVLYGIFFAGIKVICVFTGFVIYSRYKNCDPFTTKQIEKNDQLVPFFVMDIAKNIIGLPGIFICGITSAGMSSLSTKMNCVATAVYEDFIKKILPETLSERAKCNILKLVVVIIGIWCIFLSFIVGYLEGVILVIMSLAGMFNGPLLGIFTIGILFPRANAKGAFYGGIVGFLCIWVLALPAKYLYSTGTLKHIPKPLSTDGCNIFNHTVTHNSSILASSSTSNFYPIFKISPLCYTFIGCVITMIAGMLISYLTKKDDSLDEKLLSPVTHFFLAKRKENVQLSYNNIDKALVKLDSHAADESNLEMSEIK